MPHPSVLINSNRWLSLCLCRCLTAADETLSRFLERVVDAGDDEDAVLGEECSPSDPEETSEDAHPSDPAIVYGMF